MITSIPDSKFIEIFLKSFGKSDFEISNFIDQHRSNLTEIILIKIFNKYAETLGVEDIKQFENKMHNISKTGNLENQKFILSVLQDTIIKHPELADEVRNIHSEINSKLFMLLMEKADEKTKEKGLEYLLTSLTEAIKK